MLFTNIQRGRDIMKRKTLEKMAYAEKVEHKIAKSKKPLKKLEKEYSKHDKGRGKSAGKVDRSLKCR
jgi:hypothetical protein